MQYIDKIVSALLWTTVSIVKHDDRISSGLTKFP